MMPVSSATLYIKVCGLREPANVAAVAALRPDFVGFIFYPKSSRYVGEGPPPETLAQVPAETQKVGVFVDEDAELVLQRVAAYDLDLVQLHGHEDPATCAALRAAGVGVIKAFAVGKELDFAALQPYVGQVDYFLFDTKGAQPGGNGTAFDWGQLKQYNLPVPYFLAGGIGPEHAKTLRTLRLPGLYALDLNSRFETPPGVKDAELLRQMFLDLRGCIQS